MPKLDYPILLTRHLDALKAEWKVVSAEIVESCRAIYPDGADLADDFAKFLEAPGKFIRPSMFLFGYKLGGHEPDENIIRLALTFELLHTYLLVEDDIMDESDFRRGVPAVHKLAKAYHEKYGLRGDAKHFGESLAITFGLAICAKACEIWSDLQIAGIAKAEARKIFDRMHYDVSFGQYLDLIVPAQTRVPTKELIAQIMEEKTSKYTIKNPSQSGAIQGGVSAENTKWLEEFGKQLGIAYQVADDIIGVYGDPKVTGKSADSDIREGKATFLVLAALESATPADKQTVIDFYTGNDRSDAKVAEIKKIFDICNVRAKAGVIATEYMNSALDVVDLAPIAEEAKNELKIFARFVVERNK